ncbi:hypothetical protein CI109_105095 [Kwoniella shandongensis]|uniref:Uncharacterized protein n=1 Tax=Kwoniella shandongensis TaxID=1734106 RepID=A0A5M6C0X6_9TREE|nr:uncharacterized protein CI109_004305 [Kwoniella shandongensis]KAA5527245.1 hypothetical protein CI109_004305 [Kwoniella shandongensis]
MASPLKSYFGRSIDLLRKSTAKVVKMDATPLATPQTIFSFDTSPPEVDEPSHFGFGSDSEVGGLSSCDLSLVPAPSSSSETGGAAGSSSHMAFYGYMTTKVPPSHAGKIRTGYAGFRNTSRSTLFGQDNWDLDMYTHLGVVVGYRGWEGWRNRWVVNIGIDGRPRSDVFQHRLELPPSPLSTNSKLSLNPLSPPRPEFTTLHLPLSSFVLIKKGQIAPSPIPMPRTNIRTVGFALLGRDRDDVTPPPAAAAGGARGSLLRLGGWGKAGNETEEVENDPELKQMLEEDNLLSPTTSSPKEETPVSTGIRKPRATGGYHRVSTGAATTSTTPAVPTKTATSLGDVAAPEEREGYYELCIKSVKAVKWDPEMDGPDGSEV